MAKDSLPKWLVRRGGRIHYVRRVPARFSNLDRRDFVTVSCETDDVGRAIVARDKINALTEAYWRALARGEDPDARDRYRAAIAIARLHGFSYEPIDTLRDATVESLLDRIAALETMLNLSPDAENGRSTAREKQEVNAILGGEKEPGLRLSSLLETFEAMTRDERREKSEGQLHKWRLPRLRAIRHLRSVVGDKAVVDFDRGDAVAFRSWWSDRVIEEDMSAETPNKDLAVLSKMFSTVSDRLDLDLAPRFRGLRFDNVSESPPPFSPAFIRERLIAPGALAGLNDDARGVVLVMVETGARPTEIVNLRREDIRLDDTIPHISIEPYKGYSLKTRYSRREIPLVGVALEGAGLLAESRGRYRDKSGSLSATVNKYFSTNDLRESERHTLYSLRHSFKDRLTDASTPDIVDAALMGHKFARPAYGKGPTLALKLETIRKIAVSPPS